MAQHHTVLLPSDQLCTTTKNIREGVSTSFQITLLALCQECSVCSGPLQLGGPWRLYCALLGQTLAARLIFAQLRSLVKIQEAGRVVKINSMFAREKPRLEFKVLNSPVLSRGSRC